MPEQGTLESIAISLAGLFKPLEEELQAGRVRTLFAELGMEFPPELENQTDFINALKDAVNKVTLLPELVSDLVDALENENTEQILPLGVELFSTIQSLVESIDTVADELSGLAGSLPGISPPELGDFADELLPNILDYLIVKNLEGTPGFVEAFEFIDVIERQEHTSGSFSYTTRKVKPDQFINFIKSPGDHLRDLYDWGASGFDGVDLLTEAERLLVSSGAPAIFDPTATPPVLDLIYLEASPKTDIDPKGIKLTLQDKIEVESEEFSLDEWQIKLFLETDMEAGVEVIIQPNGNITFLPVTGELEGDGGIEWTAGKENGEPYLILGQAGGSRLEARQFSLKATAGFAWKVSDDQAEGTFNILGEVRDGKLMIDFSQGDGFLAQILSGVSLESDFNLGMGLSSEDGVYFVGSSTLEIQLPTHIDLGPVEIGALVFSIGISDGEFPIGLATDISTNLGPIAAVVEGIGVSADLSLPDNKKDGNLGPLNLDIGFKPPNGVGLSVDAGAVKGGGYLFFDFEREEYAGALELVFSEWIALKAIGLITTKMPDGSKGFSMLIIITVEFGTGIQLGFGFTLLGVGGLLGINRIVNIEPLKDGIRTGAVESVMFPQDVIANAPKIISDLRKFFPPKNDLFLIGPMAKIGWGTPTLISVSIGIIMEIPSVNITILGVVKVVLPDEEADILRLQVNFIGRIEPSNERLWFYAELFDSRVLFITLEGGMGLLVGWGDNANFVVSVGGFHPRYSPPPLPFPEPPRIAVSILNESYAKVRIEAYFAVTSNSVQFGAKAELYFGVSEFRIEGFLAFDALFQFDPFFFSFSLSVSLSVKVFGVGLFSVGFSGLLEGPSPWYIEGKGKISLLFFKIKVPFSHTWGEEEDTKLDPIKVFPLIEKELNALTNWVAQLPESSNILVSLRKLGESEDDQLVLHPVGTLRISQRKIPLDFKLDKVGNQTPSDVNKLNVAASVNGGGNLAVSDLQEKFAIGQFKELDDSKRLSSPAFEPLEGGVELAVEGEQLKTSQAVKRVIRYESIIIDNYYKRFVKPFFQFLLSGFTLLYESLFEHFMTGNAVTKSELSYHHKKRMQPFDQVIEIKPHEYSVAFNTNNKPMDGETVNFTSQAKANQFMEQQIQDDPKLADQLHVIPNTEINTAA